MDSDNDTVNGSDNDTTTDGGTTIDSSAIDEDIL